MALLAAQVARELTVREFIAICTHLDQKFSARNVQFDVIGIDRNQAQSKLTVTVIGPDRKPCRLNLDELVKSARKQQLKESGPGSNSK